MTWGFRADKVKLLKNRGYELQGQRERDGENRDISTQYWRRVYVQYNIHVDFVVDSHCFLLYFISFFLLTVFFFSLAFVR